MNFFFGGLGKLIEQIQSNENPFFFFIWKDVIYVKTFCTEILSFGIKF